MVDEKVFFREATLRICGSLEIEKALWNCFKYIRDFIPADMLFTGTYDPRSGTGDVLAKADERGGQLMNSRQAVSPEIQRLVAHRIRNAPHTREVLVARHAEDHPLLALFSNIAGPRASVLAIEPKAEWNLYGAVILAHCGGKGYSLDDIRLFSLLSRPWAIALSNYLRYRELMRLRDLLADDNRYLREELHNNTGEEIIGARSGLKKVMEMVGKVARSSSPVLLLGETGVGKEVIATAIHNRSPRGKGPLVKVNCGAIPETLIDSELFGHEKGAFTGALSQKRGRFERADGGTIFLDEIGELSPATQVRLLRVIQEKEIERLGGSEPIPLDIRVIAATHRNLETMLADGSFREDLYFRLRVFPIVIPPLRARRADIPALTQHFVMKIVREMGLAAIPEVSPETIDHLIRYDWPGNVRELQNAVERAIILSDGISLIFEELQKKPDRHNERVSSFTSDGKMLSLTQATTRHIGLALDMAGGRICGDHGAAKLLDVNPSTLRTKMRKLGIPFGRWTQRREKSFTS